MAQVSGAWCVRTCEWSISSSPFYPPLVQLGRATERVVGAAGWGRACAWPPRFAKFSLSRVICVVCASPLNIETLGPLAIGLNMIYLATLSSMLRLSLPSVNILSKIDTCPKLPARLDTFTEPVDLR